MNAVLLPTLVKGIRTGSIDNATLQTMIYHKDVKTRRALHLRNQLDDLDWAYLQHVETIVKQCLGNADIHHGVSTRISKRPTSHFQETVHFSWLHTVTCNAGGHSEDESSLLRRRLLNLCHRVLSGFNAALMMDHMSVYLMPPITTPSDQIHIQFRHVALPFNATVS